MKAAVLVDGGFYRRRAQAICGDKSPKDRADELFTYCLWHLSDKHGTSELYRIFYYDCPPMDKKVYHPLLKRTIDYGKSELYVWMNQFLAELKQKRKVALRLGKLAVEQACFDINYDTLKKICNNKITVDDLTENDFHINVEQKGVDMKIGLDIASLAYKQQVEKIILISADSDFVSAAKHARREGIDFILDSMGNTIKADLHEHIDGLHSLHKRLLRPITQESFNNNE